MHLVQRAIDAHGGSESSHSFVLLQPHQDAGEDSSYQVGRAERDDGTNLNNQEKYGEKVIKVSKIQTLLLNMTDRY